VISHRWIHDDGTVKFSTGFLVEPDEGLYIGYKLFPRIPRDRVCKVAVVEICTGVLHRHYRAGDAVILIKTRKVSRLTYESNKEAGESIVNVLTDRAYKGWAILQPAYPRILLETPWKNILKVQLS